MNRSSGLRGRLTLFYTALLAAVLLLFAGCIHLLFARLLYSQADSRLLESARGAARTIERELAEAAARPSHPGISPNLVPPGSPASADRKAAEELSEVAAASTEVSLWLLNPRGVIAYSSSRGDAPPFRRQTSLGEGIDQIAAPGHARFRRCAAPAPTPYGTYTVVAAVSLAPVDAALRALDLLFLAGVPLALLAATLGGTAIAGRALRPVADITAAARDIREGDLSRRIALQGRRDELRQLADTFDQMIASIEQLVTAQRRFLADASHELRTPLTVILSALEVNLRAGVPDGASSGEAMRIVLEEARRMKRLVDDLMTLARADAGQEGLARESVELAPLIAEVCERALWTLDGRRLALSLADDLVVSGDADRLEQVLLNLLQNAVQHTAADGEIRVTLSGEGAEAWFSVADDGPGIPPEHVPRLLDRFYRVDPARSRARGGAGLGLSICRWIVAAHGGRIHVSSEVGQGATFTVILPLA